MFSVSNFVCSLNAANPNPNGFLQCTMLPPNILMATFFHLFKLYSKVLTPYSHCLVIYQTNEECLLNPIVVTYFYIFFAYVIFISYFSIEPMLFHVLTKMSIALLTGQKIDGSQLLALL